MMGFAALLLGIAGWIVMCIPDCATAAIVPALLEPGSEVRSCSGAAAGRNRSGWRRPPCWSVCWHWLPRCFRVRMRCTVRGTRFPSARKREAGDSGSARKKSRNRPP